MMADHGIQNSPLEISLAGIRFGPESRNRLAETSVAGMPGALAALETFYYALDHRDGETLAKIWLDDPLVQLNNPVGGIMRGVEPIAALYRTIFDGSVSVSVTFEDAVAYLSRDVAVFAGRERGECIVDDRVLPLRIRTTRMFAVARDGWRQVHHHGSIDEPKLLARYQAAIRGDIEGAFGGVAQ